MSWRMNKIRILKKKLFVSLTLLVFCELVIQLLLLSNSRFDLRLYRIRVSIVASLLLPRLYRVRVSIAINPLNQFHHS